MAARIPHRASSAPSAPPIRRLLRDRRGVAAVEFAVILPLLLMLYIGVVDTTRGVIASRKLNLLSRTISDLVSQQPTAGTISAAKIGTIFAAATALMQPFDVTGIKLTVSAIDLKANASDKTKVDALVRWSYTQGGTLRPNGACTQALLQVANGVAAAPSNFPTSLITSNKAAGFDYAGGQVSYVVVADASYVYRPFFQQAVAWFSSGMSKTTYMVPRSASGPVNIDPSVSAPGSSNGNTGGKVCIAAS